MVLTWGRPYFKLYQSKKNLYLKLDGSLMRKGRTCGRGNFPRTCLSGSQLSWPTLTKAKSGLVPTFDRLEDKLAAPFE